MNLAYEIDFELEDENEIFDDEDWGDDDVEPTPSELEEVEEEVGLTDDWSLVTCPHCGYTFDIAQSRAYDETGQVICPKCKRSQ